MKFTEIRDLIENNKLVLPDFQRNFVWDSEKMKSLYASVICKMPIGSILTLKSNDKAFSCKKIGAKTRTSIIDIETNDEIDYLIDGQQRLTTLFAGFTTYYFVQYKDNMSKLASDDLRNLWFFKIPAVGNNTANVKDFFSTKTLEFTNCLDENISSSEVKELIENKKIAELFPNQKNRVNFEDTNDRQKIVDYCTKDNEGFYRIPLQFIMDEKESADIKNCLRKILRLIAEQFLSEIPNGSNLKDEEINDLKSNWIDSVKSYFKDCLNELALNKIEVKNSNKSRAIDIYSNLNMQGVALDIFDLIMAKVGKIVSDNFYNTIIDYIQKPIDYDKNLLSDKIKRWIKISNLEYNNPAEVSRIISSKDVIEKTYINVFLNVLALVIAKENDQKFNPDVIKKDKILDLDEKDIIEHTEKTCLGLNRALFFFQTRCGIRKMSDINYKAQIAVIAYFFTNDSIFCKKKYHDFFEYWYWISVFARMYPSNQNINILNEIPKFQSFFDEDCSQDKSTLNYLKQHQCDVLNVKFYSDEETLTMEKIQETDKEPPAVMANYICQFYLALGYRDFLNEGKELNFLYTDNIDMHHILPLGSNFQKKIGVTTKEIRKNKKSPYNSPLNMVYISRESNIKISNLNFETYAKDKNIKNVLPDIGCNQPITAELKIIDFLKIRFYNLKAKVNNHLQSLYEMLQS